MCFIFEEKDTTPNKLVFLWGQIIYGGLKMILFLRAWINDAKEICTNLSEYFFSKLIFVYLLNRINNLYIIKIYYSSKKIS